MEVRRALERESERLIASEQATEHMRIELQTVRCAFERTDEELQHERMRAQEIEEN